MAESGNKQAVLMSIHPRFAELIMDGKKTVEFRKCCFSKNVRIVLVYITSPVGKIAGSFRVKGLDVSSPTSLWRRHQHFGGISKEEFSDYFKGRTKGVAIELTNATRFEDEFPLDSLRTGMKAPQSFCYIDEKHAEKMVGYALAD
jgi:predicted transcriptional regulator